MPLSSGISDVTREDGVASTGDSARDTVGRRYLNPKQESSELPVLVCMAVAVFGVDVETRLGVQIAELDRSNRCVDIGGDMTMPLSLRDVSLLVTELLANRMVVRCLDGTCDTSALSSDECNRFRPELVLVPLFLSTFDGTGLVFRSFDAMFLFFGTGKVIFDRHVVDGFCGWVGLTACIRGLLSGDNANRRHSSDCSKS